MTQWRVLKAPADGNPLLYHGGPVDRAYAELGTYESGESYYIYGPTAAQELGPRYGAGEYLLLNDESERFKRLTIGERQAFFDAKEPPPGLSEGDLTAAEVMARDA